MSTTRLAAIMFTDIVGYTAMMQENRQAAMAAVKAYEAVLRAKIKELGGELVQTYGDGSLSTFDSASAAVACAKAIQEEIRDSVPLRIGIHLGEITRDGDHTFGDGVNIASRIESMGVAGAILMSNSIRQQIKNNPEFELTSLGKFTFKNAVEPMEVFCLSNEGLSVPKQSEMQGKGKAVSGLSAKMMLRLASIGFVAMVLGAGMFWMFSNQPSEIEKLEEIKASRIAILPFENKTNDPAFDVLGDMAADHVIQGMMNLEDVKVVSYATIRDNLEKADAQSEDFAERTGAEKLIRGNIYKQGDSLLIQSQVIDISNGEVDIVIPEIKVYQDQSRKLVGELRSRILGFFTTEKDNFSNFNPGGDAPKLKAFETYQAALGYFLVDGMKCRQLLEEAINIDSSYFWSHQLYIWTLTNQGMIAEADSITDLIDQRFPNQNSYERHYQEFNRNFVRGKGHEALEHIQTIYEKDPKHYFNNLLMGFSCRNVNLPQAGIDAMSAIDPAHFPNSYIVHCWWHGDYAFLLMKKDRDEEARKILGYVPIDKQPSSTINSRLLYYTRQGELDSVYFFLEELATSAYSQGQLKRFRVITTNYFAIYGYSDAQKSLAKELIGPLGTGDEKAPDLLLDALILAGEYTQALRLVQSLLNEKDNTLLEAGNLLQHPWRLAKMGWIYGQQGKKAEAYSTLEELKQKYPDSKHYQRAWIEASLGEKESAMKSLSISLKSGELYYSNTTYDFSYFLHPMREYQPFVEMFVRPKG